MEIKIIPYEDRKKHCVEYNPTYSSWTDDEIKLHILHIAAKEIENYEQIIQLIKILDNFDINKYKEDKITIQVGKLYFQNWTV